MEVVSKIYETMGIDQMIFDINSAFLKAIKETNHYDGLLSHKTKQVITQFTDGEIDIVSKVPFSMVVLDNKEFEKAVLSKFQPKELNQEVALKTEVLFAIQRMAANSASMEYAFSVDLKNHQRFLTMSFQEIKKASRNKSRFLHLRKGINNVRWESLRKIVQHNQKGKSELDFRMEVMLCLI